MPDFAAGQLQAGIKLTTFDPCKHGNYSLINMKKIYSPVFDEPQAVLDFAHPKKKYQIKKNKTSQKK